MFKYNIGDKIGPHENILIERLYRNPNNDNQWYCKFKCSQCNNTFIRLLSSVSTGKSYLCKDCLAIKKKQIGHNVGILSSYKDYTKVNNPFFSFIKPLKKYDKDGNQYWKIQCKKCKQYYIAIPSQLISEKRRRGNSPCPCWTVNRNSKGSLLIELILKENNIKYIKEYYFQDCLSDNNKYLFFDFYLPDYNCCIEYDGEQHFTPNKKFAYSEKEAKIKFQKQQKYDRIKNKYCKDNNIKLVRIPYWDYNKLDFDYLVEKGCFIE